MELVATGGKVAVFVLDPLSRQEKSNMLYGIYFARKRLSAGDELDDVREYR